MSSRVPISTKKKLAAKLSDLEQSSVIQKVDRMGQQSDYKG